MKIKKFFAKYFLCLIHCVELFIAALIAIAIIFSAAALIPELWHFAADFRVQGQLQQFLGYAFNTIIGIEFLKMLIKHSAGSVIEVLLLAIARQLIVEHTTPLENLLAIIAVAILFIIRKYFYVAAFDDEEEGADTKKPES